MRKNHLMHKKIKYELGNSYMKWTKKYEFEKFINYNVIEINPTRINEKIIV